MMFVSTKKELGIVITGLQQSVGKSV